MWFWKSLSWYSFVFWWLQSDLFLLKWMGRRWPVLTHQTHSFRKNPWNVCPCQLHTRTCRASTCGVSSPSELNQSLNLLLLTFCQRFYLNIAKHNHCEKAGGSRSECKAELNVLCNLCGQQGLCCACGSTPSANTGHTSKHSWGRPRFAEGQSRYLCW